MRIITTDGDVKDLPDSVARVLVDAGKATRVPEIAETADADPAPENASQNPLKP
jgi:hypothetical protein